MNASVMSSYNFMLITCGICTGLHSAPAPATSKVAGGMKLGKAKKSNQFLESLKAEGELILEDTQPSGIQSRLSSVPLSDLSQLQLKKKSMSLLKEMVGFIILIFKEPLLSKF